MEKRNCDGAFAERAVCIVCHLQYRDFKINVLRPINHPVTTACCSILVHRVPASLIASKLGGMPESKIARLWGCRFTWGVAWNKARSLESCRALELAL